MLHLFLKFNSSMWLLSGQLSTGADTGFFHGGETLTHVEKTQGFGEEKCSAPSPLARL